MIKLTHLLLPLLFLLSACASDPGEDGGAEGDTVASSQENSRAAPPVKTQVGTVTAITGAPLPQAGTVDFSLVPTVAPEFSWRGDVGEDGSLADYRGNVLMINFWGTWCPPCRRELPDIVALRDELSPRGFEVLGVALNERPKGGMSVTEQLSLFAEANNMKYPLLIANTEIIMAYGSPPSVPTTFILDREGKISSVHVGLRSEAEFRAAIEPLL